MDQLKNQYQYAASSAEHSILRHPARSMAEVLRLCAERAEAFDGADEYGKGELIEQFEARMAKMLGKPAALFLPSGTLAQPMALRIHADQRGRSGVALHPSSHPVLHEQDGYEKLWGLQGYQVGDHSRVIAAADFAEISAPEKLSSIFIELPMREIGGQLPSWEDLQQQVNWARQHGLAVHLDGARLWQCESYYQRSFAEICELFDSVYVSLYKDLAGIAGAVLAGTEAFIAKARIWTRRAGGNLISMYPYVLAAEQGLADNLAVMPKVASFAQQLAPLLASIPGVTVNPEQPQAGMFHLHIKADESALISAVTTYAEKHRILLLPLPRAKQNGRCICEIPLGRNALQHPASFWHEHLAACLAGL
ncbi:threonine aldolase [Idiomarina tyrosinivorans]|uniref:Threonine aldolase n=1 Tax=Idiomarina tyrosinivorans TaxID=1445662 RepID=A0A432ZTB4_9GAMM|nr:beta-eliminating lyase-related protein [Idiomarina tyrosinivorans]RUO81092.1 threonine aldolase [Idiomarina tyrosinivorans]